MHLPVAFCATIVDRLQLAHVGGPTLKPVFERSHLFLRCDEMRLHLRNLLVLLRLGRAEAVEILCNVEEPWGDAVELVDEGADSGHDAPQLHRLHAAADEGARRRPCRPELQGPERRGAAGRVNGRVRGILHPAEGVLAQFVDDLDALAELRGRERGHGGHLPGVAPGVAPSEAAEGALALPIEGLEGGGELVGLCRPCGTAWEAVESTAAELLEPRDAAADPRGELGGRASALQHLRARCALEGPVAHHLDAGEPAVHLVPALHERHRLALREHCRGNLLASAHRDAVARQQRHAPRRGRGRRRRCNRGGRRGLLHLDLPPQGLQFRLQHRVLGLQASRQLREGFPRLVVFLTTSAASEQVERRQ
mmetsp:Transcript_113389/g.366813  ORF Transcript_113389/g.366813 Transcript_113389/m.366813 type:complete len:366 (+) Transcript_113389:431-1528(+)